MTFDELPVRPRRRRAPLLVTTTALTMAVLLTLTACATREPRPTPATTVAADTRPTPAPTPWWTRFDDPLMGELITEALQTNLDLGIARARLRQARALRDQTAAGQALQLGASASSTRSRTSSRATTTHSVGLDASWEADLSGELAAAERGARADVATTAATLAATRLSVAGEVGLAYVQLRANRARRALVAASLATQQETLQLTRWRTQAGLASGLDVDQAQASAEQTRAQLPAFDTAIAQGEHALALLLGLEPAALRERLGDGARVPGLADEREAAALDRGVPADLLRQRPDVQAAEHAITAELARLDQTAAARRPSFRLSGTLGWQALTLSALGGPGALVASLAAAVDWPILDGGRGAAQEQAQQAVLDRARLSYQATALEAARDVEDTLAALAGSRAQARALDAAADAARRAQTLARQRYEAGLIDFTTLLDTQRTLLALDSSRLAAATDTRLNQIRLYKALGGAGSASDLMTSTPLK